VGMIGSVGLVLHPRRDCAGATGTIIDWARLRGASVLGLADEVGRIDVDAVAVDEERLAQVDLVVSLGGDGTVLRALRLVQRYPRAGAEHHRAPVLGVNLGRLGFLAEIDIPELDDALSAIDEHKFVVEGRSAVLASFGGITTTAFNDVALVRIPGRGGSAVVELTVEGHRFLRYAADAVVVATPTGSTAYSFSAGGPIVSPRAEGLLVIPSAPHSAFNRALFLSAGEDLALTVLPNSAELAVEADGRLMGTIGPGDVVTVSMLPAAASVVRLGRTSFYQRAQRRLGLAGSVEADAVDGTI
jgi:NAD+ kinase